MEHHETSWCGTVQLAWTRRIPCLQQSHGRRSGPSCMLCLRNRCEAWYLGTRWPGLQMCHTGRKAVDFVSKCPHTSKSFHVCISYQMEFPLLTKCKAKWPLPCYMLVWFWTIWIALQNIVNMRTQICSSFSAKQRPETAVELRYTLPRFQPSGTQPYSVGHTQRCTEQPSSAIFSHTQPYSAIHSHTQPHVEPCAVYSAIFSHKSPWWGANLCPWFPQIISPKAVAPISTSTRFIHSTPVPALPALSSTIGIGWDLMGFNEI
jgi:hypothetical protein